MKYLQINTVVSYTSIGRIMRQNYDEKKAQGWDCLIAYGRGDDVEGYRTIKIGTGLDYRMQGIATRLFDRHGYGSKRATREFIKKMEEYNPDIIHLHNIHGYYLNFELLFAWLKAHKEKKVIWTLHDCWAMTGHCTHFTAVKCDRWKTKCLQCPQKNRYPSSILISNARSNYERKKRAFTGVQGMKLVVPSHWLEGIVKESFLQEYRIEVIHNKIDTNIFRPTPSNFREKYGLEDKKIILGVANVWDRRKGLYDLIKLAGMLDNRYAVVLVGLNKRQLYEMPKKVKKEHVDQMDTLSAVTQITDGIVLEPSVTQLYWCIRRIFETDEAVHYNSRAELLCLQRTENAHELAGIYTAADVFVNPTYEDNYPTVNLEAKACGTPVITYDAGGARETLISLLAYNSEENR